MNKTWSCGLCRLRVLTAKQCLGHVANYQLMWVLGCPSYSYLVHLFCLPVAHLHWEQPKSVLIPKLLCSSHLGGEGREGHNGITVIDWCSSCCVINFHTCLGIEKYCSLLRRSSSRLYQKSGHFSTVKTQWRPHERLLYFGIRMTWTKFLSLFYLNYEKRLLPLAWEI